MMIWRSLDNGLLVKMLRSIISAPLANGTKPSAPPPSTPPSADKP